MRTWKVKYLLCCVIVALASCQPKSKQSLYIATAANVQFAMEELTRQFEKSNEIPCEIILGSSGKLTAQIMEGAPYDVFVSANMMYPEKLFENGKTTAAPEVYGHGILVLWSANKNIKPEMQALLSDSVKHIAVANPKTAPYGVAAVEVLKKLEFYDQVEHKLVFGESISQVNQFITSGAAEIGFTAKSIVVSKEMKGIGSWMEVESLYSPIAQGAVVIKGEKQEEATKFYEFLFSREAKEILERYGYRVETVNP